MWLQLSNFLSEKFFQFWQKFFNLKSPSVGNFCPKIPQHLQQISSPSSSSSITSSIINFSQLFLQVNLYFTRKKSFSSSFSISLGKKMFVFYSAALQAFISCTHSSATYCKCLLCCKYAKR